MGNNTIFPLTTNLIVPATGNPNKGFLLFPAGIFGLSYDIAPKPRISRLDVVLSVVEISTQETVWPLGVYEITEQGFSRVTNKEEIEEASVLLDTAKAELLVLQEAFSVADTAFQADPNDQELLDGYTVAYDAATAKQDEVNALEAAMPEPMVEYVNKYSDVVGFFNGDGTLTDEGVLWAKTIPFGTGVLGDYI